MTKFVIVSEPPEKLHKGEFVVRMPDFFDEIRLNKGKAPRSPNTAPNHLRAIAASIGQKYAPDTFNSLVHVKPHSFQGRPFSSEDELSKIVCDMFRSGYPEIFEMAIDHQIKNRPFGTKLIYFVGDFHHTTPFTRNGIDQLKSEEVDAYMGRAKDKKPVGRPSKKEELTVTDTPDTV